MVRGALVTSRRVGDDEVEVNRTSQRGSYVGAWTAYLGDLVPQVYDQSVRVTERATFFEMGATVLRDAMREWFPMAQHLLSGLFQGFTNRQRTVAQRERLLALGSLSAGLPHELNNPAAAAVRATATLRESVTAARPDWTAVIKSIKNKETLNFVLARERDAVASLAATTKQRRKQHGVHA